MDRITQGITISLQRFVATFDESNTRRSMMIAILLLTAIVVIFVYQINRTHGYTQSANVGTETVFDDKTPSTTSNTTEISVKNETLSEDKSNSMKSNSTQPSKKPQSTATVEVNGSTTRLKDDQTFHKVITDKNGSTTMTIRSSSSSRGNNESSLNLDLDYSSETEVSRDSNISE